MPVFSSSLFAVKKIAESYFTAQRSSSLFSYHVLQEPDLTLIQQETGYSLSFKIAAMEPITLSDLTLTLPESVAEQSLSLHDAAVIELMLHLLGVLYAWAATNSASHLVFKVNKEEADLLLSFESFFEPSQCQPSGYILKLPTFPLAQEGFQIKASLIRQKVAQELWARQKDDKLLRLYLQNPFCKLFQEDSTPMPTKEVCPLSTNVIDFVPRLKQDKTSNICVKGDQYVG